MLPPMVGIAARKRIRPPDPVERAVSGKGRIALGRNSRTWNRTSRRRCFASKTCSKPTSSTAIRLNTNVRAVWGTICTHIPFLIDIDHLLSRMNLHDRFVLTENEYGVHYQNADGVARCETRGEEASVGQLEEQMLWCSPSFAWYEESFSTGIRNIQPCTL